MSGSSIYGSGKVSDFINYLEKKLIDDSLAAFQREQIAAAIGNLESAFEVTSPHKTPLTSPSESRRSSIQSQTSVSTVFSETDEHLNSEDEREEENAASLLRKAIREQTEFNKMNKTKRKSLLEVPKNENESPFSLVIRSSRSERQLQPSSFPRNLFATGDNNNHSTFLENNSRRQSDVGSLMDDTIHKFCEQFAKGL